MTEPTPGNVDDLIDAERARSDPKATIGKLADLLERSGIDVADVAKVNRVNAWQGFYKDPEGNPQTVDMVGIQLVPEWADGPTWPVIQPCDVSDPVVIKHRSRKPLVTASRRTLLIPDPQIGYWLHDDGTRTAMHDEAAMDVDLCLIDLIRPNVIGNMGDFLDLSEWSSKFAVHPEFVLATRPALVRGNRFLAEQQAAAGPELESHWLLEGNHDERMMRAIVRNAMAALRLKRVDDLNGWPVLSVPNLLALDKLGVEYVDGYPAGRKKVAGAHGRQAELYALHGEKLDMTKQAKAEIVSTIQGHAHHVSMHSETHDFYDGRALEIESYSIGCTCRVDGAVPSTKGAPGTKGRPTMRQESWQQAVAVVTEDEDGWDVEVVRIRNGRAVYRGKTVTALVEPMMAVAA